MSNRPSTIALATISTIDVPATIENQSEISVDRETPVIPDMASALERSLK